MFRFPSCLKNVFIKQTLRGDCQTQSQAVLGVHADLRATPDWIVDVWCVGLCTRLYEKPLCSHVWKDPVHLSRCRPSRGWTWTLCWQNHFASEVMSRHAGYRLGKQHTPFEEVLMHPVAMILGDCLTQTAGRSIQGWGQAEVRDHPGELQGKGWTVCVPHQPFQAS